MTPTCTTNRPTLSRNRVWWNLPLCVAILSMSGSLAIVAPILMPYWKGHGLSMSEIWILQGSFALMLALSQIPSGYWADAVSRKRAMLIGTLLCPLGDCFYAFGDSFSDFLIGEILFGFAIACTSGADSALIYESLLFRGEEKNNSWWAGMAAAGTCVISAIAALSGGYLIEIDVRLPFLVTATFATIQIALILFLREPPLERPKSMLGIGALPQALSHCLRRELGIKWIMLAWCFLGTATWVAFWFYPLYFKATGWNERQQGMIFALYYLAAGVASLGARHFKGRMELLVPIFLLLALCTVSGHLLFGLVTTSWGLIFGLLHQFCKGVAPVVFGSALHERTPSHMRTTVLSIQGALVTSAYGALTMRLGWAAEIVGFQTVLLGLGLTLGGVALWLWTGRPQSGTGSEQARSVTVEQEGLVVRNEGLETA